MSRPRRAVPADLAPGWPDTSSDDPAVETARLFAVNLTQALDGTSLRAAETFTGVDHTTIAAVIHGRTWPDQHTIARLEAGLKVDLWPTGTAARTGDRNGGPSGEA